MGKKTFVALVLLFAAGAFYQSTGATVYWMESDFAGPRLLRADGAGLARKTLPLPAGSLPQAIAADSAGNGVFWTELSFLNAHVRSANGDLGDTAITVSLQSCLRGIALDQSAHKLYWTGTNLASGPAIFRANTDGSSAEALISFGSASAHSPNGIAIDQKAQMVYFADFDAGAIARAPALAGALPQNIVTGLGGPVGVALDLDSGKLYWTDANNNAIGRAALDGSGATAILNNLARPQYLAIDNVGRRLYWTEAGALAVRSAKLDGSDTATLYSAAAMPCGIAVVNMLATPVARLASATGAPSSFGMDLNGPDQAGGRIQIAFRLPHANAVFMSLTDLRARKVITIGERVFAAGRYRQAIETAGLAPGIYLFKFTAGEFTSTKKCVVVR